MVGTTPETADTTGCRNAQRGSFVGSDGIFHVLFGGGESVVVEGYLYKSKLTD